jgi:hypothetical protein
MVFMVFAARERMVQLMDRRTNRARFWLFALIDHQLLLLRSRCLDYLLKKSDLLLGPSLVSKNE